MTAGQQSSDGELSLPVYCSSKRAPSRNLRLPLIDLFPNPKLQNQKGSRFQQKHLSYIALIFAVSMAQMSNWNLALGWADLPTSSESLRSRCVPYRSQCRTRTLFLVLWKSAWIPKNGWALNACLVSKKVPIRKEWWKMVQAECAGLLWKAVELTDQLPNSAGSLRLGPPAL